MPIQIICTGCQAKLKAPDTAVGKKTKCPKCQTIVSVPATTGDAAASVSGASASPGSKKKPDQWFLQTPDGSQYGPVVRGELDQWFSEGRVSGECQLLKEGSTQWQWAAELYPTLSKTASSSHSSPLTPLTSTPLSSAPVSSPLTPLSSAGPQSSPFSESLGTMPLGTPALAPLGSVSSPTATLPSYSSSPNPALSSPFGPTGMSGSPSMSSSAVGMPGSYAPSAPAASYGSYGGTQRRSGPHALAIISGIFSILFGAWNVLAGIIFVGLGILVLVGGGTAAAATASTEAEAAAGIMMVLGMVGAFGIVVGLVPLGYGIGQICTGVGVMRRRQWARVVTFVFCGLCLINLFIHILGILTLNPYSFLVFFADIVFITIQMIAMCMPDVTRDFA